MHFLTDMTAHTTAFDRPVVDHWLERKMTQTANATTVQIQSGDPNLYSWVLYRLSYVPLSGIAYCINHRPIAANSVLVKVGFVTILL